MKISCTDGGIADVALAHQAQCAACHAHIPLLSMSWFLLPNLVFTPGAKVACIELPFDFISSQAKGGVGGTCVLRGCVPKKLMVYASEYADDFKDSVGFG